MISICNKEEFSDAKIIDIAERLQIARIARGYKSRRSFAAKFGLKLGTYNAHETGANEISATCIPKYCCMLDVSIEWLLIGKGKPFVCQTNSDKNALKMFAYLTYVIRTGKPITPANDSQIGE